MQLYADHIYIELFPYFLPFELAVMILSYTHLLQSKQLTYDISNYCKRKIQLKSIYYNKFIEIDDDNSEIDWLSNDLVRHANDYQATNTGMGGLIKRFQRLYLLRDKDVECVREYITRYLQTGSSSSNQINTLLGLLTHIERDNFFSSLTYPRDMCDP
jgi:hypothetical protein